MILESLAVAQAQLGECITENSGFCTLQTDGTTKFGEHYMLPTMLVFLTSQQPTAWE